MKTRKRLAKNWQKTSNSQKTSKRLAKNQIFPKVYKLSAIKSCFYDGKVGNVEMMRFSSIVKTKLLSRLGQFVPAEQNLSVCKPIQIDHQRFTVTTIPHDDVQAHEKAQEYMIKNFYSTAPVAKALLTPNWEKGGEKLARKEMNIFLQSGCCFAVRFASDNSWNNLQGLGLSTYWSRNPEYEVLRYSAKDWHNTAADIAHSPRHSKDPRFVYRDFQFQHLYDMCQTVMNDHKRNHSMWLWALELSPSARKTGLTVAALSKIAEKSKENDIIIGSQANFRGFDPVMYKSFPGTFLHDEVKYEDEELEIDGQKVFSHLKKLDAVRYFFCVPN